MDFWPQTSSFSFEQDFSDQSDGPIRINFQFWVWDKNMFDVIFTKKSWNFGIKTRLQFSKMIENCHLMQKIPNKEIVSILIFLVEFSGNTGRNIHPYIKPITSLIFIPAYYIIFEWIVVKLCRHCTCMVMTPFCQKTQDCSILQFFINHDTCLS